MYDRIVERTCSKNVGFLMFNVGSVELSASIPKRAYGSEEIIPITIKIINQSSASLQLFSLSLKQKTKCIFTESTRPKTERIHKLEFSEQYLDHVKHITRKVLFPVPNSKIMSSSFKTSFIEVSHYISIKLIARGRLATDKEKNDWIESNTRIINPVRRKSMNDIPSPPKIPLKRSNSISNPQQHQSQINQFQMSMIETRSLDSFANSLNIKPKSCGFFDQIYGTSVVLKVEVPFVIGGFPHGVIDYGRRGSVDTLPGYLEE